MKRVLYDIHVAAGIVSGRSRMSRKRHCKKRRFAVRAQTLNAQCFVRFASFAAFKETPRVYRAADQQPQYQAKWARRAGYGLVANLAQKSLTARIKKNKNKKLMRSKRRRRSDGIRDNDALNRLFSFALWVNNPSECDI